MNKDYELTPLNRRSSSFIPSIRVMLLYCLPSHDLSDSRSFKASVIACCKSDILRLLAIFNDGCTSRGVATLLSGKEILTYKKVEWILKDYRENHHRKPLTHHQVNVQAVTGTETRIYEWFIHEQYYAFHFEGLRILNQCKCWLLNSNNNRRADNPYNEKQITIKPPHSNSRVKYLYPISLRWLCLKLIFFHFT
ncbi:hypothetical protein GQX74_003326 [Glossina fuscipes]|nr:hypothetical protein GQX74_003326 [Glossina fuscipes]